MKCFYEKLEPLLFKKKKKKKPIFQNKANKYVDNFHITKLLSIIKNKYKTQKIL